MAAPPVATLKLVRKVPVGEFLTPAAPCELIEVSDEDIVEFLVGKVGLYVSPISGQIVISDTIRCLHVVPIILR
jgi:hypothetical protein